jgi:hypothetical protein
MEIIISDDMPSKTNFFTPSTDETAAACGATAARGVAACGVEAKALTAGTAPAISWIACLRFMLMIRSSILVARAG